MAFLVILEPEEEARTIHLKDHFRIGRRPDNDLAIDDVRMSRYHVRFEKTERGWALFDNGSTSGSFVNEERTNDGRLLVDGDLIRFGCVRSRFVADE